MEAVVAADQVARSEEKPRTGAEAVQIGLQRRPEIALLNVAMPRLGGIDAAITLRELQPRMRLALYGDDLLLHRARALERGLPLFDTLDFDGVIRWLELEAQARAGRLERRPVLLQKLSLECTSCGYGIARTMPPDRCPMCQRDGVWIHRPWRPFSRERGGSADAGRA